MMKELEEQAIMGENPFINALEEYDPTELICWECGCEITNEEHIDSEGSMGTPPLCTKHFTEWLDECYPRQI